MSMGSFSLPFCVESMSHKVGQSILVMNFEIICAQGVKMVLSKIFLCEKNVKYKGEIFESSDLTHIHRDE